MPATYRILQPSDHADSFNDRDSFALDVLVGLSSTPKSISSKYFYDERGSELFRQISLLPEYYLTERELEIIDHRWTDIAVSSEETTHIPSVFSQEAMGLVFRMALEMDEKALLVLLDEAVDPGLL